MKKGRKISYKDTPFCDEVKVKCAGLEKVIVQNVLWSSNPQEVFEKNKKNLSEECQEVIKKLIEWKEKNEIKTTVKTERFVQQSLTMLN